ncbi:hypothetical protein ABPG72_003403 [Tetrahymena utriculariae]
MNTEFELPDQPPFLNYPHTGNGFSYFKNSPFGKLNYNNSRSPVYFQNNPPTSNRYKKSHGSNNGNILHQNIQSSQYLYPNNNGSSFSQFFPKESKFEDSNKPISNFDTQYDDQDRCMNENNFCFPYQNTPTPFNKKINCEFNNDFQYQNKNMILNNNNNNNSIPYNNNTNFMQNINSNINKSQNLINDKINYNNVNQNEINIIPAIQSQKITRRRGRPKKNLQTSTIVKKQKNSGCIAKKRKQNASSSSDIDDEIEKEYLKEIQQASDQKNSEKYKNSNSIDSMKAEEESLSSSEQSKQQIQQNQYQITTRKSSKSRQNEKSKLKNNNDEENQRVCKDFNDKQRLETNERMLQGFEQKQPLLDSSSLNREGSQSKLQNIQQISNLLIQGGRQFGSPGSVKQIREKFIQQRNKQIFSNLAEDNINFFPKIISQNLLQKKQQKISSNKQKLSPKQNKNIMLILENVSSSEVAHLNQYIQNKHLKYAEKQSSENKKSQDSQNTNSQNQQDSNQKKQFESEKQLDLLQKKDKQDNQSETEAEADLEKKINNSKKCFAQYEISDVADKKESPKQQPLNLKQNNSNQNDEFANRSTTLNSIIQSSSLKNLNKKYLQSTKLSKKIKLSKVIKKLLNQKKILKKKLIKKNQNKYQQYLNFQQQNPLKNSFDAFPLGINLSFLNNSIKILQKNNILHQPQVLQELESEKNYLNQAYFFEKQSILYQNLSKQLVYLANWLRQKFLNSVLLRQMSSQQQVVRDERGISRRVMNANNNKNFEYPNNFHHILPQHLINGSFVRQD